MFRAGGSYRSEKATSPPCACSCRTNPGSIRTSARAPWRRGSARDTGSSNPQTNVSSYRFHTVKCSYCHVTSRDAALVVFCYSPRRRPQAGEGNEKAGAEKSPGDRLLQRGRPLSQLLPHDQSKTSLRFALIHTAFFFFLPEQVSVLLLLFCPPVTHVLHFQAATTISKSALNTSNKKTTLPADFQYPLGNLSQLSLKPASTVTRRKTCSTLNKRHFLLKLQNFTQIH